MVIAVHQHQGNTLAFIRAATARAVVATVLLLWILAGQLGEEAGPRLSELGKQLVGGVLQRAPNWCHPVFGCLQCWSQLQARGGSQKRPLRMLSVQLPGSVPWFVQNK